MRQTILFAILFIASMASAQEPMLNFHHVTHKQGLNDGLVNAVTQDSKGYIWFASLSALNRFNGTVVKRYTHDPADSNSVPQSIPYTMTTTPDGRIWIGYETGLVWHHVDSARFVFLPELKGQYIYNLAVAGKHLYITCTSGFYQYNWQSRQLRLFHTAVDKAYVAIAQQRIYGLWGKNNQLLMGIKGGFLAYDENTRILRQVNVAALEDEVPNRIMNDGRGGIWISNYKNLRLLRTDSTGEHTSIMDHLVSDKITGLRNMAADFTTDAKGRVWVLSSTLGLAEYHANGHTYFHRHNNRLPFSLYSNHVRSIYCDRDGRIWLNSIGSVDYFEPDRKMFSVVFPFDNPSFPTYARGIAEAKDGTLWMTTIDGISRFQPHTSTYQVWQNGHGKKDVLHYNSVRGIAEEDETGRIWIATARGVNRLDPATGQTEFLTGKDSIPEAFYFSLNKDRSGNLWFGTRDFAGLYYYDVREKQMHSITGHPVLYRFNGYGVRCVYEDSQQRLWMGFNGAGLGCWDKRTGKTWHWKKEPGKQASLAGDVVLDIKEDQDGVIWVSFFGGMTGIDLANNRMQTFDDHNGLRSNVVGGLAVDARNRLWIGTARGLALLDSARKTFSFFTEDDGLPTAQFSEHPAITARNGDFLFATNHGYVRFNPLHLVENEKQLPCFIAGVRVFDKPYQPGVSFTHAQNLSFGARDNFFSIELEALNFSAPNRTWYAYRLKGFDKDWHITQDPKAVYTNVPGGDYEFEFKAANKRDLLHFASQTVPIHVATVYYKTWWFIGLMIVLLASTLYLLYRKRMQGQKQMLLLQGKAQLLEKEKTLVLYESLKQQLNPHFLFNSLTSLSGLIETDQKLAGKFLRQLSKIYRYLLNSRDSEVVSLKEEMDFAQVYIDLQKTRFGTGLQVDMHIDAEYYNRQIAPVTLQNLIENAIKHNITDKDTPLYIQVLIENDYLVVRNNLQRKEKVETSNKQGLAQLQSLYRYMVSRPVTITETSTHFTICIPLI